MDLTTVTDVLSAPEVGAWRPGDAWLAGGTWLFSEPQPAVTRLLDLTTLGWPPLVLSAAGLEIAATCTIAELEAYPAPPEWVAAPLIGQCCRSFLASFKIWNVATVGGNLCNSLPAGPMTSLAAALDGACTIWTPEGGERRVRAVDFVTGDGVNALRDGELLRAIHLPAGALACRTAFTQTSLAPLGRSAALLVGRLDGAGLVLTVTAATRRPVQLTFSGIPDAPELARALEAAIPVDLYHDDVHGLPSWRRHLTAQGAEQIRRELLES